MKLILADIERRRARRALSPEAIAREDVETLLAAAHLAPSCNNSQPWRFVVADDPDTLEKVKGALSGGNYWAKQAPVIIAVASRRDLDCMLSDDRDYFLFGCGMAIGNLMAQATSMGLIAHPIGGYKPELVKAALGIPESYVVITLVIVGRPGDVAQLSDKHRAIELGPRERRPLEAVAAWNAFPFADPPAP
jgi:glutaredoxin-dependent peroxiredoxin